MIPSQVGLLIEILDSQGDEQIIKILINNYDFP